ncbi:MAG TPA: HEAT repeat domain-containing protein [Isosphaeraceae bacterium]
MRGLSPWLLVSVGCLIATTGLRAQQLPAVQRAVAYLRNQVGPRSGAGENALAALAMAKAEVPRDDPALVTAIRTIEARFTSGGVYTPERRGGVDVYEAGVIILALANYDPVGRRSMIEAAAAHLVSKQKSAGCWGYDGGPNGDTSISQYAVLGLWEAENAGVRVSPSVWDNAATWFISVQWTSGGWVYHPGEGGADTMSMTAAGAGSLLICRRQLSAYKRLVAEQNPYLVPVLNDEQRTRYKIETPDTRIVGSVRAGLDWLSKNFTTGDRGLTGASPYYALYGIERVGALAGRDSLGRLDWYERGAQFLNTSQQAGGNWSAAHGDVPNTAWGVLFLTKATTKTLERITVRKLGAGELFGGKGLPRDLSSISEAGGRLVARPMDGAVEGMLSALEDPRSDNADSALAGLLARYEQSGPPALAPYKDRFRKLLSDSDPGVRRVAAWALARTADLAMVPVLADALKDNDDMVVREVRRGLQLLSRKIDGFGPPDGASPAQREQATKAWRAWYEEVRPLRVDNSATAGGKTP